MTQAEMFPDFDGKTYRPERDKDRLAHQLGMVKHLMLDGRWRTLGQVEAQTGAPQASVSARLRDLRKPKFGGYTVERRYVGEGVWEYRVLKP
jgi:hypothetical protein